MDRLNIVSEKRLCLGCGICENIGKEKGYKVSLSAETGFYSLTLPRDRDPQIEKEILNCCPSVNFTGDDSCSVWGRRIKAFNAYSTDPEIRFAASSGGVVTSICLFLLKSGHVSSILHVAQDEANPLLNKLVQSKDRQVLLARCSSRYAPSRTFHNIKVFLDSDDTFCFVGKPCDIFVMKSYLNGHPEYSGKIKFFISIFCAGMPSYNATREIFAQHDCSEADLVSLKYRGNGWPGYFAASFRNDKTIKMDYSTSWGKVLGRHIHFRCKICPDGVGLHGDIAVGDAWQTANGYPDFTERPGKSFVLVRTETADKLIGEAIEQNAIVTESLDINSLSKIQPTQHQRRCAVGYRILGIQIMTLGLFRIRKMHLFRLMMHYNPVKGLKNTFGCIARYRKLFD